MISRSLSLLFLLLSLSLVFSQQCPNSCSGHGTCSVTFQCSCDPGWGGVDCSLSDIALTNGVPQHGAVGTREWRYYHIDATSSKSGLLIEVNQTTLTGDVDTYVRYTKRFCAHMKSAREDTLNIQARAHTDVTKHKVNTQTHTKKDAKKHTNHITQIHTCLSHTCLSHACTHTLQAGQLPYASCV